VEKQRDEKEERTWTRRRRGSGRRRKNGKDDEIGRQRHQRIGIYVRRGGMRGFARQRETA
jgi:hypothetical protein